MTTPDSEHVIPSLTSDLIKRAGILRAIVPTSESPRTPFEEVRRLCVFRAYNSFRDAVIRETEGARSMANKRLTDAGLWLVGFDFNTSLDGDEVVIYVRAWGRPQ